MEHEFEFTKSMPGFDVVQKCLQACTKQDFGNVTRADFDNAIDAVAKAIASEKGVTYTEALTVLMAGDQGRALYNGREECPPTGSGSAVKKIEISKGELMENAATAYAQAYRVPMTEARAHVAEYYATQNSSL